MCGAEEDKITNGEESLLKNENLIQLYIHGNNLFWNIIFNFFVSNTALITVGILAYAYLLPPLKEVIPLLVLFFGSALNLFWVIVVRRGKTFDDAIYPELRKIDTKQKIFKKDLEPWTWQRIVIPLTLFLLYAGSLLVYLRLNDLT